MNTTINKSANELYDEAEIIVAELNEAIRADRHSVIKEKRKAASEAVDACNEAYRREAYAEFLAKENPFLYAIQRGYIDRLTLKVILDKETQMEVASIKSSEEVINLLELESEYKTKRLSSNGQWVHWVEKFTFLMSARVASDLDANPEKFKKLYKISPDARSCDIGPTPTSKTQMVKQLQIILDGILFIDNGEGKNIYKALNRDVAYILNLMCKKGKERLSVSTPRTATMIKLITEVFHQLVINSGYGADFEIVKEKKSAT